MTKIMRRFLANLCDIAIRIPALPASEQRAQLPAVRFLAQTDATVILDTVQWSLGLRVWNPPG